MTTVNLPTTKPTVGWCQIRPPEWWEVGDPDNNKAIKLCRVCPELPQCQSRKAVPGMITAAEPRDDNNRRLAVCPNCCYPRIRTSGGGLRCRCLRDVIVHPADHHEQVVKLLASGDSYSQVAAVIGSTTTAVKTYWDGVIQTVARERVAA